jgi:hypothetical protein
MSADPHDGQKKRHLSSPETEARDYLAHCHVTPKSSACSSVGGAVPTSPPLRQKECPQDESSHRGCATCEGAGVIYVIDWQLEGAAPTSTPLKHGPDCPLSQMIGSMNSEGEIEVSSWPESACSCVPTSTPLDALRLCGCGDEPNERDCIAPDGILANGYVCQRLGTGRDRA